MNTTRRSAPSRQRDERGSITLLEVLVGWIAFAFLMVSVWLTFSGHTTGGRTFLLLALLATIGVPFAGHVARKSREAAEAQQA
jgi:hypothetical protein